MIKYYLILAFRNLLHHKFQSLFSIVGLAVAFYCFGFFAYFVHGYATWDEYYEKHDRVVELWNNNGLASTYQITNDQIQELQQRFPEVEAVFRHVLNSALFEPEDSHFQSHLIFIECDTTLQHIYEPTLLAGDWEKAKAADYSMVLTKSSAIQIYGSVKEALGQQLYITYNRWGQRTIGSDDYNHATNIFGQEKLYTIRAIVEDLPYNSSLGADATINAWIFNGWIKELSLLDQSSTPSNLRVSDSFKARILLREGTDIDDFCQRLNAANIAPQVPQNASVRRSRNLLLGNHLIAHRIYPLGQESSLALGILITIILLPGVVVLLSALSNFFHLMLSNILMRRREYTLRRAHGAHTFDLWQMVSTQVFVSLLLVGGCTLLIVKIGTPWLQVGSFLPNTEVMLGHTCQHLALLLALGLLIAWMVVVRVRKDSLHESMQTSTGQKPKRHLVRHLLLGWQLTVGYFFLAVLVALLLQIRENNNSFLPQLSDSEKENIITLPFNVSAGTDYDMTVINEWKDALSAVPSIQDFSFENPIIGHMGYGRVIINDRPDTIETHYEYFSTIRADMLKISLLEGQWPLNPNDIVVDQNFAEKHHVSIGDRLSQYLAGAEPGVFGGPYVITGIIDNYMEKRFGGLLYKLQNTNDAYYFVTTGILSHGQFTCRSYPGQADQMREVLLQLMRDKRVLPEGVSIHLPSLMDEIKEQNYLYRYTPIINILAGIAMCLALLGIYSAIATDCTTRRKEMAIRKINGAKAHHIALRFCRTYGLLLALSMLIAIPILYILLTVAKEGFINTSSFFDFGPLFWLGTAALMLLLIAIATGWQVWNIARIRPAEVIKSE